MRPALLVSLAVLGAALAGCSSGKDSSDPPSDDTPPGLVAPPGTYFTLGGGRNLTSEQQLAFADQLFPAVGGYQATGQPVFEPSMGISPEGNLFFASFRSVGLLQYTFIIKSSDQGLTWTNVGPFLPGQNDLPVIVNSNDPFMFVDPYGNRIYKLDMCLTLAGFCVEISDDEGATWTPHSVATGEQTALDHQSFASAPSVETPPTVGYPAVMVFCVNRGLQGGAVGGAYCSTSLDGGIGWTPLVPGFPAGVAQCSGLHGHVKGSPDGTFYRGNPACGGPAVYRSDDGGFTWTEHIINGTVGSRGHDIEIGVDEGGGVHAFWIGADGLPYLASSSDRATTWTDPIMVAPPGVTATGFPTAAGGAPGRVAFAYIGTDVAGGYGGTAADMNWTGYLGYVLDAYAPERVVTTAALNNATDYLDAGRPCGGIRCGGFGDFISMSIAPDGRPYVIMAHNGHGGEGIMGTLVEGPTLRGEEILPLPHLAVTGPAGFTA